MLTLEGQFAELQDAHERLKLALDSSDLATFHWDIPSGKVHLSERWNAILGGEPRETRLVAAEFMAGVHPDDVEAGMAPLRRTIKGHSQEYRSEFRIRTRQGGWRWVVSRGKVVERDGRGRALRVVGTSADITPRKVIEYQLRESEDRFRRLAEISSDWFWEQDENLRFTAFSDGFAEFTGYRPEELLGKTRWEIPVDLAEAVWKRHRADLQARRPFADVEYQARDASGGSRWYSVSGEPVFDSDGVFRGYRGTGRNITERKALEERLRRKEAELRLIVDSVPAMISRLNRDLTFTFVNRAHAEFLESSVAGLVGRSIGQVLSAEKYAEVLPYALRALAGEPVSFERAHSSADGVVRWLALNYVPDLDADGHVVGFYGLHLDITARKAVQDELLRLNLELEHRVVERTAELTAANAELEAFSLSVSHDLRAPIGAISGFSHLLKLQAATQMSDDARHLLARIEQNADHMSRLVDALLEFGRLSRRTLGRTRVEPAAIVAEVLADLEAHREGRAIDIRISNLPACEGDPVLVRQVFANLLSNALKFSGKRADARIEIGAVVQNGIDTYYVKDNGAGFDMRHAGKLFGTFQRLHSVSEFEGTGIGLATVNRIVQRHGGRLWVHAETDKGATFYFTLSAANPQAEHSAPR